MNLTLTGTSCVLLICVSFSLSRLLWVVARIDDSWFVAESKLSVCEIKARIETKEKFCLSYLFIHKFNFYNSGIIYKFDIWNLRCSVYIFLNFQNKAKGVFKWWDRGPVVTSWCDICVSPLCTKINNIHKYQVKILPLTLVVKVEFWAVKDFCNSMSASSR